MCDSGKTVIFIKIVKVGVMPTFFDVRLAAHVSKG